MQNTIVMFKINVLEKGTEMDEIHEYNCELIELPKTQVGIKRMAVYCRLHQ